MIVDNNKLDECLNIQRDYIKSEETGISIEKIKSGDIDTKISNCKHLLEKKKEELEIILDSSEKLAKSHFNNDGKLFNLYMNLASSILDEDYDKSIILRKNIEDYGN